MSDYQGIDMGGGGGGGGEGGSQPDYSQQYGQQSYGECIKGATETDTRTHLLIQKNCSPTIELSQLLVYCCCRHLTWTSALDQAGTSFQKECFPRIAEADCFGWRLLLARVSIVGIGFYGSIYKANKTKRKFSIAAPPLSPPLFTPTPQIIAANSSKFHLCLWFLFLKGTLAPPTPLCLLTS
jgi:hypothetical protein